MIITCKKYLHSNINMYKINHHTHFSTIQTLRGKIIYFVYLHTSNAQKYAYNMVIYMLNELINMIVSEKHKYKNSAEKLLEWLEVGGPESSLRDVYFTHSFARRLGYNLAEERVRKLHKKRDMYFGSKWGETKGYPLSLPHLL